MALFFVVINSRIEARYRHDPLSTPRETYDFVAFTDIEPAHQKLISELDINTTSLQAAVLRRSFLVTADIPESMLDDRGSGDRWINDRLKLLLREAGIRSFLVPESTLQTYLGEDVLTILSRLQKELTDENNSPLIISSLELGGAVTRALSRQIINILDGANLIDIAHKIGESAWNDTKPTDVLEKIENLLKIPE
jgi:hypothetical protein